MSLTIFYFLPIFCLLHCWQYKFLLGIFSPASTFKSYHSASDFRPHCSFWALLVLVVRRDVSHNATWSSIGREASTSEGIATTAYAAVSASAFRRRRIVFVRFDRHRCCYSYCYSPPPLVLIATRTTAVSTIFVSCRDCRHYYIYSYWPLPHREHSHLFRRTVRALAKSTATLLLIAEL